MRVAEFVSLYRQKRPNGHFFDKETLLCWGEKLSQMSYNGIKQIRDYNGRNRQVHEVRTIQNDQVLGTRWTLNYFDIDTLDEVFPADDIVDRGKWVKVR